MFVLGLQPFALGIQLSTLGLYSDGLFLDSLVSRQNGRVTVLYRLEEFVLHIHILPHIRIGGGRKQALQDILHIVVSGIELLIHLYGLGIGLRGICLVEHAQHLLQTVVHTTVQQRYLHDDAVVRKALHKGIGLFALQHIAVIVVCLVTDVDDGGRNVSHPMAEDIHRHHRQGMSTATVVHDVLLLAILRTEILAETQRLRLKPCLLEFNEHKVFSSVFLTDGGTEINAEHGDVLTRHVGILVRPLLHLHHLLLQQRGEQRTGDALVLHQIFEHRVVYRVREIKLHFTILLGLLYGMFLQSFAKKSG